tara:strand:- start:1841 stop:3265 length:1425 start_codon:yes stop_codon:yes gene_type:complete
MSDTRDAIFISHANPEDNAFTMWLGARLTAAGYDVWADILRLHGGDDWQRKLEHALRSKACKVLLVGTAKAVEKQGVRNEIQIAHDISIDIKDSEFIIPLKLEPFQAPFLIVHAQYIDFEKSWADGLAKLLKTLDSKYNVPRKMDAASDTAHYWRDVHMKHARAIINKPEPLISNWLAIKELPAKILFHDFKAGISIGAAKRKIGEAPWPIVSHNRGFIGFAPASDLEDHFGSELPLKLIDQITTEDLIRSGWPSRSMGRFDAMNMVTNLVRQAMELRLTERGLSSFDMSSFAKAWWPTVDVAPVKRIGFDFGGGLKGSRQITGYSEKRKLFWHYGVTPTPRLFPVPHIRLVGRIIFSEDGSNPLDDAKTMHRYRRSFARGWRNAKWRDMMLSYLKWLVGDDSELLLPVANENFIKLNIPPIVLEAPVSIDVDGAAVEEDAIDDLSEEYEPLSFDDDFDELPNTRADDEGKRDD